MIRQRILARPMLHHCVEGSFQLKGQKISMLVSDKETALSFHTCEQQKLFFY